MRFFFPLAIFCLLTASPARAVEWWPLIGAEGVDLHVDVDSVVQASPGLVKAWVLHSYAAPQQSLGRPAFSYKSSVQLYFYNCAERTSGVVQETFYADDNRQTPVNSNSYSRKNLDLDDVVPGSIGEGALEFVCAWNKRGKKK